MHGDTNLYSGQKYNNWSTQRNNFQPLLEVINPHSFYVDTNIADIYQANLKPVASATLQAGLLDAGSVGGRLDFKDPWLIDSVDQSHGGAMMNRGMDKALFKSVPYAINNLGTSTIHKGVFLNQNPRFEPGKPNYSVGAPNVNTFNVGGQNYQAYFQNWTGDTNFVQYQYPSAAQTGVVFKQNGATATARYKAHLGSSIAGPTGGSGQRKLVEYNGYHLIYESSGEIWYTRSQDLGQTWTSEIRVSSGAGNAHNPCFAGK